MTNYLTYILIINGITLYEKDHLRYLELIALVSCSQVSHEIDHRIDDETQTDKYFVTEADAQQIAEAFFGESGMTLLGTDVGALRSDEGECAPAYYVYQGSEGQGFVIVSASETAYPVLGYSRESSIDLDNLPCALEALLGQFSNQIVRARKEGLDPSYKVLAERENALRANSPAGNIVVDALLGEIKWNQSPYYNDLCPSGTPVGCVATATSMIMRYWEYPESCVGEHGYKPTTDFSYQHHTYNYELKWGNMPKAELREPNFDVARFCYGVAVALDMNFDYGYNGGSGTVQSKVPIALKRHYYYPETVGTANRSSFSDDAWHALMRNELANKRPVQYGGIGNAGGHSFVCDGYDDTNMFHINWGWGGMSDGWFKLDALDPDDLGTGGGGGGFNKNQHIVLNFAPPAVVFGDNNDPISSGEDDGEVIVGDGLAMVKPVVVYTMTDVFIRYTSFNNIETVSGAKGYETFTTKAITSKVGGEVSYVVEADIAVPETKAGFVLAVDFNNDGLFDVADGSIELVGLELAKGDRYEGKFTVPTTVAKGNYRMRVVVAPNALYNPNGWTNDQLPAVYFNSGEIEDYKLIIE